MVDDRRRRGRWVERIGRSLAGRLAVISAVPVLLLLSVAGAMVAQAWREEARNAARTNAHAYLRTLAVPCGRSLAVHALDRLDLDITDALAIGSQAVELLHVAVYDKEGRLVAQSGDGVYARDVVVGDFIDQAVRRPTGQWRERFGPSGHLMLDVSAPAVSGLRWGTVVGSFDIERADEARVLSTWVIVAGSAALILLLSATLALSLRFLLVDPVDELARAAAEIRRGQFGARAWVVSRDELGGLATDFNAMADELESYTTSLERKVEERSVEVQRKNVELEGVNAKLAVVVAELELLATVDGLTAIPNRRVFDRAIELETQRGIRRHHDFCVVMVDVDHFKHYNDTNGHPAGDRALQKVASVMRDALRTTDLLARYGGEEFVVLLLDTDLEAGVRVAESLRRAIEASSFEFGGGQPMGRVTVSVGVAAFGVHGVGPSELLARADEALYAAKRGGRNRALAWTSEMAGGPE